MGWRLHYDEWTLKCEAIHEGRAAQSFTNQRTTSTNSASENPTPPAVWANVIGGYYTLCISIGQYPSPDLRRWKPVTYRSSIRLKGLELRQCDSDYHPASSSCSCLFPGPLHHTRYEFISCNSELSPEVSTVDVTSPGSDCYPTSHLLVVLQTG